MGHIFLVRAHSKIFFISIRSDHLKLNPLLNGFLSPMLNNLEYFIYVYTGLIINLLKFFHVLLTMVV